MQVTKVRLDYKCKKDKGICADVTVVLDDVLAIHNIHVIAGGDGYFVAFPNTGLTKMTQKGKRYKDIVHPLNKTLRTEIEEKVLKAFTDTKV